MLLAAMEMPEQICGLVGTACATDSLLRRFKTLPRDVKTQIKTKGIWEFPSRYSDVPYVLSWKVVEEAHQHELLDKKLEISCPVRLLHGMNDLDVPYRVSLDTCKQLKSSDVTVTLIKDGDHRLSDPTNLVIIKKTVKDLFLDVSD